MNTARKRFGREVVRARAHAGMTQQELADAIGVKLATIEKIEAGRFNVSVDIVTRIAVVTDTELRLVDVKPLNI